MNLPARQLLAALIICASLGIAGRAAAQVVVRPVEGSASAEVIAELAGTVQRTATAAGSTVVAPDRVAAALAKLPGAGVTPDGLAALGEALQAEIVLATTIMERDGLLLVVIQLMRAGEAEPVSRTVITTRQSLSADASRTVRELLGAPATPAADIAIAPAPPAIGPPAAAAPAATPPPAPPSTPRPLRLPTPRPTVLHVRSNIPGSLVTADNIPGSEVTPVTLRLPPGKHLLIVSSRQYNAATIPVLLGPGEATLTVEMQRNRRRAGMFFFAAAGGLGYFGGLFTLMGVGSDRLLTSGLVMLGGAVVGCVVGGILVGTNPESTWELQKDSLEPR